ncbi:FecR family protein [Chitinophaga alhagiae]|uniref:FecR family protein n=1 Tax=Chitinophaga alhagiae TaxID=2203219 RepID=UPI000E5ACA08|nr:FecR family protein [Chitinophaga alhagiae]
MSSSEERQRYEYLAHRWKNKSISPEEETELMAWLNRDSDEPLAVPDTFAASAQQLRDDMYARIKAGTGKKQPVIRRWVAVAAAAAVLFAVAFSVWLGNTPASRQPMAGPVLPGDVPPGGNMATLTLGNGKTVQLSSARSGVVINTAGLTYNDGSAVDAPAGSGGPENLVATTPRGGTYQIILPDGSKVWLNAASSLKFPSTFKDQPIRTVELSGEAYFEIARVKQTGGKGMVPFIVSSNGQQVEVLGTQFNVSGYPEDGQIRTTLVEGSVRINGGKGQPVLLQPGQQAVWTNGAVAVRQANIEEAVAWKNGYFMFNDEPLGSIMQKLSRWYNIDPVFEDDLTRHTFFGMVSKSKPISAVLNIMETTGGVHFKIEGRKVIVKK